MEVDQIIVGSKLSEIQKKPDEVRLVFENSKTRRRYVFSFRGLLFETSGPALNRKVRNIQFNKTLGFRATSQLRHLKRDPNKYKQIFIQMEGSNDENKLELLLAFRNYKISQNRFQRIKRPAILSSALRSKPLRK